MSRSSSSSPTTASWPIANPWPFLLGGLGAELLALLLRGQQTPTWVMVRVVLIVLGLIAAGGAVNLRLQLAAWDLDSRLRSAGLLALAGLAALLGIMAMDADWDSARLLLAALSGLALGGAVLILLPRTGRRLAVSILLLYHFGGILIAATSVAPPSGQPHWITHQIWTRFYRPYLQFMYLNNAYHFYSPEPGPPTLLWFYIEYEDGSGRWVKIPNREDFRTKLEFQRRLAMTESTNLLQGPSPFFQQILNERVKAWQQTGIPLVPFDQMHPVLQHRIPTPYSKKMTAAYARHVARNYPHETDPTKKVLGVKVYRVIHRILNASEFLDVKKGPYHQTTYMPYYHGVFDRDGKLLDPSDPFLYWLIPILEGLKDPPERQNFQALTPPKPPKPEDLIVYDFLEEHAKRPAPRQFVP